MNKYCVLLIWTMIVCLLACKKEEVRPFQISEDTAVQKVYNITIFNPEGDTARHYTLKYTQEGYLDTVIEKHYHDEQWIKNHVVSYGYAEGKVVQKTWKGFLNKGIHGTNIYSKTSYEYWYDNEHLSKVVLTDSSSFGEREEALVKSKDTIILISNKQPFADTLIEKHQQDGWVEIWSNEYFKYQYKADEEGSVLVKNSFETTLISTQASELNPEIHQNIKLVLYQLYEAGGEVPSNDTDGFLRTQAYYYTDPLVEHVLTSLPVSYNGINYIYRVNFFGQIKSIIASTGYVLQFNYQKQEVVL